MMCVVGDDGCGERTTAGCERHNHSGLGEARGRNVKHCRFKVA